MAERFAPAVLARTAALAVAVLLGTAGCASKNDAPSHETVDPTPTQVTAQPEDTTYHSGSPAASTSLSVPMVRHGKRPTAGRAQPAELVLPSVPVMELKLPGASGHGSAPGLFSLAWFAWAMTYPMSACFARFSAWALRAISPAMAFAD